MNNYEIMRKRINEIKIADKKSLYELAQEMGISETTLYNFVEKDQLSSKAENILNEFLRKYLTKDEKLEAYRLDNADLKAENEALIEGLGVANKYVNKYRQTLQEIKNIAEPFAKCYTHTCRNCEKYDSAHACCLKDINCYKYNDGSKSSCKDFVLPTKQFYQQILANVITKITKAEEE